MPWNTTYILPLDQLEICESSVTRPRLFVENAKRICQSRGDSVSLREYSFAGLVNSMHCGGQLLFCDGLRFKTGVSFNPTKRSSFITPKND
jgi:hypothetical protein